MVGYLTTSEMLECGGRAGGGGRLRNKAMQLAHKEGSQSGRALLPGKRDAVALNAPVLLSTGKLWRPLGLRRQRSLRTQ